MIISKKVLIKINYKNYKFYIDKGYKINSINNMPLEISIIDLYNKSRIKIDAACDICGEIKKVEYKKYNEYTKNQSIPYNCWHCNTNRIKESFEKRFGIGITNSMHVEKYKKYHKQQVLKSRTNEVKDKIKATNIKKYGFKSPCENIFIKNKLKEKINSRSKEQKEQTLQKRKETCFKKYGVSNVNQVPEILLKSKNTRIIDGRQIPDCKLTEFQKYRKLVNSYTNKLKKIYF